MISTYQVDFRKLPFNHYPSQIFNYYKRFDENSNRIQFEFLGLLLIFFIGVILPILAIVSGITGKFSLGYILLAGGIYFMIIIWHRCISAGFGGAMVALSTFDIVVNIVRLGPIDGNIIIIDPILIAVATATIVGYRIEVTKVAYLLLPLMLFATWTLVSGAVNALSSPLAGILFGVTQFRYVLVGIAAIGILQKFGFRPIMTVLLSSLALQSIISTIQSITGSLIGLSYFGEYGSMPATQSSIDIGLIELTSGLFTGGFSGSSRALVAILCLVFPVALFFVYQRDRRSLPAIVCIVLTPIVMIASRTENGYGTLGVVIFFIILLKFIQHRYKNISSLKLLIGTGISLIAGMIVLLYLLSLRLTPTSGIRYDQYIVAIKFGLKNPIFGIGVGNFDWLTNNTELAVQYSDIMSVTGVHNTFLAFFAGSGVPGLLFYLFAIGVPYWYCLQKFVSKNPSILAGHVTVGMISFHVFSSLSWVYHREIVMIVYWLTVVSAGAYAAGLDSLEKRPSVGDYR